MFIKDNLLTKNSTLKLDNCIATKNETLSPTTEGLIVLRCLELLCPSLPNHIVNVFSHELKIHTLRDVKTLIVTQIDSLTHWQIDLAQKKMNVSLIAGVKDANIQWINNYSNNRKNFSQFCSDNSKRPYIRIHCPT